jgi:hypothetical protein
MTFSGTLVFKIYEISQLDFIQTLKKSTNGEKPISRLLYFVELVVNPVLPKILTC